ncbi:MAG TPA: AMP-binding protein, partial [Thermoanaerobaculia bacterium]|nr:AMP-binding protein [Thermoanaerobaculia bacterium]
MHDSLEGYRLSPQQRRLWMLLDGASAPPSACGIALDGDLDPRALEAALTLLVESHEIFRTSFVRRPGMRVPVQVVFPPKPALWERVDLSDREAGARQLALRRLFLRQAGSAIEADRAWALRPVLVRCGPARHVLLLALPALCADGRTLDLLPRELGRLYAACREGDGGLAEPVQYVQVSEWLNQLDADPDADPGRRFWQQRAVPPALPLGLPFERAGASAGSTASVPVADLAVAGDGFGATPAAVLLASWAALLHRLTGRYEIVVGTLFDGRTFEELAEACGLFARSLPVSLRCGGGDPFRALVGEVRDALARAESWQDCFVGWESPPAAGSRAFHHAAGFALTETPAACSAAGIDFSLWERRVAGERSVIELDVRLHRDRVAAALRFAPAALSRREAARMAEQLAILAADALEHPDAEIGALAILGRKERRLLVTELNATAVAVPERPVHSLFEEQAARTPEAPAVVHGDVTLTYRDLDRQANGLACRLSELGAGPDMPVAILAERSPQMLAAILAVLKAGGAYLPIDAGYPPARIRQLLEDAHVPIIIAGGTLRDRLPADPALIVVDPEERAGLSAPSGPAGWTAPESLAYVIYTSGSTGRPKGVMVTHRGLSNYLAWAATAYGVSSGCRAPVHSPIGFDLTVTTLFAPLLAGGSVVLLPEEQGIEALADDLAASDSALVKLTPSHLDVLRELLPASGRTARGPRVLILGGEALTGRLLAA